MNDITKESNYFSKGSILLLGTFIGGFIANYFFNVTISRVLGPHDYGNYKVAEAFIALGSLIALMGGSSAVAKFLPESLRQGTGEGVWEYTRFYLKLIVSISCIIIGLVYVAHQLHYPVVEGENYHPILLASLAIPLAAISALFGSILQVAKRLDLSFIPWRVGYPLLRLIFCGVVFVVIGDLTEFQAVAITIIVSTLIMLFCFYQIRRLSLMPMDRSQELVEPLKWLKVSTPLMLIIFLQKALNQADIYMIEYMANEVAVGHFAAAQTTADAVNVVRLAMFGLLIPLIVPALKSGNEAMIELNRRGFSLLVKLVIPLAILVAIFSHPILAFFGHDTELAHQTMLTLLVGYVVNSMLGLASIWLQYSGKEKITTFVIIGALLINISLNALLIPILNIEGAAIATTASLVFLSVTLTIIMYKHLKIFPWTSINKLTPQIQ
ncbi:MAG: oligosaccharide flippase family protein [Parashewanella sp.]